MQEAGLGVVGCPPLGSSLAGPKFGQHEIRMTIGAQGSALDERQVFASRCPILLEASSPSSLPPDTPNAGRLCYISCTYLFVTQRPDAWQMTLHPNRPEMEKTRRALACSQANRPNLWPDDRSCAGSGRIRQISAKFGPRSTKSGPSGMAKHRNQPRIGGDRLDSPEFALSLVESGPMFVGQPRPKLSKLWPNPAKPSMARGPTRDQIGPQSGRPPPLLDILSPPARCIAMTRPGVPAP